MKEFVSIEDFIKESEKNNFDYKKILFFKLEKETYEINGRFKDGILFINKNEDKFISFLEYNGKVSIKLETL